MREILDIVNGLGGSFYALTDHSTLAQCSDTGFHPVGNLQPVRGTEWTTDSGHSCVLGLQGNEPIAERRVADLVDDAMYRGGMMQINHPTDMAWSGCTAPGPRGWTRFEIFNGPTGFRTRCAGAPATPTLSPGGTTCWRPADHRRSRQFRLITGRFRRGAALRLSRVFAPSNDTSTPILKYWKLGQ